MKKRLINICLCLVMVFVSLFAVGCTKNNDENNNNNYNDPPSDIYEITKTEAGKLFNKSYDIVLEFFENINDMSDFYAEEINKHGYNKNCIEYSMNNLSIIGLLSDYFSSNNDFDKVFVDKTQNPKYFAKVEKQNINQDLVFKFMYYVEESKLNNLTIDIKTNEGEIEGIIVTNIKVDKSAGSMTVNGANLNVLENTISFYYGNSKAIRDNMQDFVQNMMINYGKYTWEVNSVIKFDFNSKNEDEMFYINYYEHQLRPSANGFKNWLDASKFENTYLDYFSYQIGKKQIMNGDYIDKFNLKYVTFNSENNKFEYENLIEQE